MKLFYTLPGKVWWIHNFLDYNMYKGIYTAIIREREKINLRTTKDFWEDSLLKNIRPPKRVQVSDYKPFESLKTLVTHNPYLQLKPTDYQNEMTTTIHYMEKGSGIQWHDDTKWTYGATYYLNKNWSSDWGGEFMFADKTSHGFLPVVANSLAVVKSPFVHKVNTVLSPIMPRMSIQIFMR